MRQMATRQRPSTMPAKNVCASKARAALLRRTANASCERFAPPGGVGLADGAGAAVCASLPLDFCDGVVCLLAPAERIEKALRCVGMPSALLAGLLAAALGASAGAAAAGRESLTSLPPWRRPSTSKAQRLPLAPPDVGAFDGLGVWPPLFSPAVRSDIALGSATCSGFSGMCGVVRQAVHISSVLTQICTTLQLQTP